ncbi:hypothetical protein [Xenorhabdus hominickii]|uniref:Uncharacterized protein n=1 Tax=Xenorhabdus hominickii TaxID=351679 RepID=A0A2G0QG04_XENHO|nr:hypothetical protein [Xenorhabdus hominickii]AOM42168.1 hypothetical protein A9255_17360 [Xenorhabdus hominickii]PHM58165.1 hypothetical protein Xhom_01176 [Xenorhabdus hominickii]
MPLLLKTLFSFIFLVSSPSIAGLSTPAKIMQQLYERGVNSVVAQLGEEGKENEITHNITTGDSQWLKVAFALSSNMNPKFSQQVSSALSLALINNPVEVLALAKSNRTFSPSEICNIPATISSSDGHKKFIKKVSDSLNAARKSNIGSNKENVEVCLLQLDAADSLYF